MRPIVLLASQLHEYIYILYIMYALPASKYSHIYFFLQPPSARYNEKIEWKKRKIKKKFSNQPPSAHIRNTRWKHAAAICVPIYIFVLLGNRTWKFYTIICDWYERAALYIYIAFIQDKHTLSALYRARIFQQDIYGWPIGNTRSVVCSSDLLKLK